MEAALRRMGHDVIGMEHYVAEGGTPLERCLADVRSADIYIVIVAWRYGYVPKDEVLNPLSRSITELEYTTAEASGKSILAFLLDPNAPWPPSYMDALSEAGGADVLRFRRDLGGKHLAGIFRTADHLAGLGAPAVAVQGMNQHMAQRALRPDQVSAELTPFTSGEELFDTTLMGIQNLVANAGSTRALAVQMGYGNEWWSTRLYLLAALLQQLTCVRQLVFVHSDGKFAGMASPAATRDGLCSAFPKIRDFDEKLRSGDASQDAEREIARAAELWKLEMRADEADLKVGVRPQLVSRWLGGRLVTRCITVDAHAGLTMVQVQQIIDSLIPDVPVQQIARTDARTDEAAKVMVVDRDQFAVELAREWVQTGLPRTRVGI